MTTSLVDEVNVLKLTLHGRLVGYLVGFRNGRNVLSFADTSSARRLRSNGLTELERAGFTWRTLPRYW